MRSFLIIGILVLSFPCFSRQFLTTDSIWKVVEKKWTSDSSRFGGADRYKNAGYNGSSTNVPVNWLIWNTLRKRRVIHSVDAYYTVYILNPDLLSRDSVPTGTRLKMPERAKIGRAERRFLRHEYRYYSRPGKKESNEFNWLSKQFFAVNDSFWRQQKSDYLVAGTTYHLRDSLIDLSYRCRSVEESVYGVNRMLVSYLSRNLAMINNLLGRTGYLSPPAIDTLIYVVQDTKYYFRRTDNIMYGLARPHVPWFEASANAEPGETWNDATVATPLVNYTIDDTKPAKILFEVICNGYPDTGYSIQYQSPLEEDWHNTTGRASTASTSLGPFIFHVRVLGGKARTPHRFMGKNRFYDIMNTRKLEVNPKQSWFSRLISGDEYTCYLNIVKP